MAQVTDVELADKLSNRFDYEVHLNTLAFSIFNDALIWQYEMGLTEDERTGELISTGKWDDRFRSQCHDEVFPPKEGGTEIPEDSFYFLLHMYLAFHWDKDNDLMKNLTIKYFAEWSQKHHKQPLNFNEVKALIKKHWFKPNVTGITEKMSLFPKTAGNWYSTMVDDYIKMMHELNIPAINEEKIHDIKNRGMAFHDFWWLYGAMAKNFYDREEDIFDTALMRFRENVSNEEKILIPMLQILFDNYSEDKDWVQKHADYHGWDVTSKGFSKIGYSSLMFARHKIDPYEAEDNTLKYRNDEDRALDVVTRWLGLKSMWNRYVKDQEGENSIHDNFGSAIKEAWLNPTP